MFIVQRLRIVCYCGADSSGNFGAGSVWEADVKDAAIGNVLVNAVLDEG